jgi:6-phosphofructokinase 2
VEEVCLRIANETREDFAVTESSTGKQYRFVLPGPVMSDTEALACVDALLSRARIGDFVVASGSLPRGVRPDFYGELSDACSQSGARFVLDCAMPTLANSLRPGVFLIKPSFSEFKALTGVSPLDERAALGAIRAMIAEKRTSHVALTLGDRGAWLVGPGFALAAAAPSVKALSAIGAGDSFLAGLVLALASARSPSDSLRSGVAAGTAALLAPGVELCQAKDFERLKPLVVVREMKAD